MAPLTGPPLGAHPGVTDADDLQKKVLAQARQNSYPEIKIETKVLKPAGSTPEILAVLVPASQDKPHFGGVAWIREGSQSIRAPDRVFKDLIASQNDKVRRLQNRSNKQVKLQMKSAPTGFLLEIPRAIVLEMDAHHIRVQDLAEGLSYSFSVENVLITGVDPENRLVLEVPWNSTEPAIIEQLARRWSISTEQNARTLGFSGLANQLINHPENAQPVVASMADSCGNPNIRFLLASLDWELKRRKRFFNTRGKTEYHSDPHEESHS
ncbi:MAG: hypothetical protein HC888_11760 [Candidatus Competibacteraceae bacterium]|nr:hypothetical protein [Candidatus Competibacteraceae bacterium]